MNKQSAMIPWQGILLLVSLILWPVLPVVGAISPLEQAAVKNTLEAPPGQTAGSASTTMPKGLRQTLHSSLQVIERLGPEGGESARTYRTINVGQDLTIRFEPQYDVSTAIAIPSSC